MKSFAISGQNRRRSTMCRCSFSSVIQISCIDRRLTKASNPNLSSRRPRREIWPLSLLLVLSNPRNGKIKLGPLFGRRGRLVRQSCPILFRSNLIATLQTQIPCHLSSNENGFCFLSFPSTTEHRKFGFLRTGNGKCHSLMSMPLQFETFGAEIDFRQPFPASFQKARVLCVTTIWLFQILF